MSHIFNEAFKWMYYSNESGTKGYWIFNSRDGVTPFSFTADKEYFNHISWNKDFYRPYYIPKENDLIWSNLTKSKSIEIAKSRIASAPQYLPKDVDKDEFTNQLANGIFEDGKQPMLCIIKEGKPINYYDHLNKKPDSMKNNLIWLSYKQLFILAIWSLWDKKRYEKFNHYIVIGKHPRAAFEDAQLFNFKEN